jgi:hypothetical protein
MSMDQIMVAALIGAAIVGLIWIERSSRKAERQPADAVEPAPAELPVEPAREQDRRRQRRR